MKEELIIVYQKETDGEIVVEKRSIDEVKEIASKLDAGDYALLGGEIIKHFDGKEVGFDLIKNMIAAVKKRKDAKN